MSLDIYKLRFFSVLGLFAVTAGYVQFVMHKTGDALPGPLILFASKNYVSKPAVTYAEVAQILRDDPKLRRKLKKDEKIAFDLAALHAFDDYDDIDLDLDEYAADKDMPIYGAKQNPGDDIVLTKRTDAVIGKRSDADLLAELTGAAPKTTAKRPAPKPNDGAFLDRDSAVVALAKEGPLAQKRDTEVPFNPQEVVLSLKDFDKPDPALMRKKAEEETASETTGAPYDVTAGLASASDAVQNGLLKGGEKIGGVFAALSDKTTKFFTNNFFSERPSSRIGDLAETDTNAFILPVSDAVLETESPDLSNRQRLARKVAALYDQKRKQTLAARKMLKEKKALLRKVKAVVKGLGVKIEDRYASLDKPFFSDEEMTRLGLKSREGYWRYPDLVKKVSELEQVKQAFNFLPVYTPVTKKGTRKSSNYGYRRDPFTGRLRRHTGIDYAAKRGTPVTASAPGVVTYAGVMRGYGNIVEIFHGKGLTTRYAHLHAIKVKKNAKIPAGKLIGLVGSTGRSTGPHLHYEVRLNGKPLNPDSFLKAGAKIRALLK